MLSVEEDPRRWCISYQQLLDIDQEARIVFGEENYGTKTMRDICQHMIVPLCEKTGTSYALSLNPNGLPVDVFITHSWDGYFASFVQSICSAFQTTLQKPSLWICAFALTQHGAILKKQLGSSSSSLENSPFVLALAAAKTFCVVRNSRTDLYSRVWCVCELLYAKQHGMFPERTHVTGPDVFSNLKTSCLEAQASREEDKKRIMDVLLREHDPEEIDNIVQLFRTQQTPKAYPNEVQPGITDRLKKILHPLCDLDNDLMDEHMKRFQPGTRQWALDSFDQWRQSTADDRNAKHRVFVLAAPAGVGKTGIACKIVRARSEHIVACHFCRHDDSRRSSPKHMLLSLAYQLACRFPDYRRELQELLTSKSLSRDNLLKDLNVVALFDELLKIPLSKVDVSSNSKSRSYVIVIDALDECEESGKNEMLLCLQRHFKKLPYWIHLFVTTRPEIPVMDKLKSFSPTSVEPNQDNNMQDLRIFFQKLLPELSESIIDLDQEVAVEKLVQKSGGLFIYASHLASMLRTEYEGEHLTLEDLDAVPTGLDDFHELQFERLLVDTECLAWRVVECAIAAQEPLHVETIQSFLGCSRSERIAALHKLSSFFVIDAGRKLNIYHKSLRDWLTDPDREDLEFFVDMESTKRYMAQRCWALLCESGILTSLNIGENVTAVLHAETQLYLLNHGIHHLVAGNMKQEARNVLLDVGWLLARAEKGAGYKVVQDCNRVAGESDKAIVLLGRAIGLSASALRKDPRQLPSQLIGRLLPSVNSVSLQQDPWRKDLAMLVESLLRQNYGFDWWCPMQATWVQAEHPCSAVLEEHTHIVYSVAWSQDGRLVSGANDKTVRLWLPTGECDLVLRGHNDAINSVAWSPDGVFVVSASSDKSIRLWNATSGDCELTLLVSKYDTYAVTMTADHKMVSGTKVWSQDGTKKCELLGHKGTIRSLAVLNGGPSLASASDDSTVRVWNVETGVCEAVLVGHDGPVNSVAWGRDASMLVSGGGDRSVRIWNVAAQSVLLLLEDRPNAVLSVAMSPDFSEAVIGIKSSGVEIMNITSGKTRHLGYHQGYVNSVAWGCDGRVATGSGDMTIKLWNPSLERVLYFQGQHLNIIRCKDWSPNGELMATGADDWQVRVWSAEMGRCVHVLKGHKHNVGWVSFSPDNQFLVSASWDKTARVWDVATGSCEQVLQHAAGVTFACWSLDAQRIATTSIDHRVRVFSTRSGDCITVFDSIGVRTNTLTWSRDVLLIFAGSEDGSIRWLDVEQGQCSCIQSVHSSHITMLACSYDNNLLASASHDTTCCIWEVATGRCRMVLEGHERGVSGVAWSQDSKQLLANLTQYVETIRIWDVESGTCQQKITSHCQIPPEFAAAATATIIQDFSAKAPEGIPVGVACRSVLQYKDRAAATLEKSYIKFFQQVTENSPAPPLSWFQKDDKDRFLKTREHYYKAISNACSDSESSVLYRTINGDY